MTDDSSQDRKDILNILKEIDEFVSGINNRWTDEEELTSKISKLEHYYFSDDAESDCVNAIDEALGKWDKLNPKSSVRIVITMAIDRIKASKKNRKTMITGERVSC